MGLGQKLKSMTICRCSSAAIDRGLLLRRNRMAVKLSGLALSRRHGPSCVEIMTELRMGQLIWASFIFAEFRQLVSSI